eukprot:TRINITY_DN3556_c0_g1_i12.p1 TRINITY_DN3556_c0_g1~~TRINITY_DN3556_c0_g1_i12.p1  ORF type:complete len:162 (-),score=26.99 TRINITY_DN3556_c0_g1_i12:144-629(-)
MGKFFVDKERCMTTVFIGSDHAGFEYKATVIRFLQDKGLKVTDCGPAAKERCDYPDFSSLVCKELQKDPKALGVLICGSGIGMSISANKHKGVRCGLAHDYFTAINSRAEGCNCIALGERVIGIEVAKQIINSFLNASIDENGQELKSRLARLKEIEEENL